MLTAFAGAESAGPKNRPATVYHQFDVRLLAPEATTIDPECNHPISNLRTINDGEQLDHVERLKEELPMAREGRFRTLLVSAGITACLAMLIGGVWFAMRCSAQNIIAQTESREDTTQPKTSAIAPPAPTEPIATATSDRPPRVPAPLQNSIGLKLVLIPAGEFQMGLSDGFDTERPVHRVRITKPFYLGMHEVTRGQFAQFVAAENYRTECERNGQGGSGYDAATNEYDGRKPKYSWRNAGFKQTDDHPVVNVSWNDAQAFCVWLSKKEGKTYRLPTEAEWEYACRAGTMTKYAHGDDPEGLATVGNVNDATAEDALKSYDSSNFISARDGYVYTAPVGSFKPNSFGLHDMLGNVSEWCADRFGFYKSGATSDPSGPLTGSNRVSRGGGWVGKADRCRSAFRFADQPDYSAANHGFRVALIP